MISFNAGELGTIVLSVFESIDLEINIMQSISLLLTLHLLYIHSYHSLNTLLKFFENFY